MNPFLPYRRQYAKEQNYEVFLVRMEAYATPKCHILVGIPKEKLPPLDTTTSISSSNAQEKEESFAEFIRKYNIPAMYTM